MSDKASAEDVLAMIEDGGVADAIAKVTNWSRDELVDLARQAGYGVNVANGRFQPGPKRRPGATECLTCAEVDHLIRNGEPPINIPARLDMTPDAVIRDLFRHQSPHANTVQRTVLPEKYAKEKERRGGPAAVPTLRPTHRDLIEEGKAHSSARVQRAATKAQVALEQLSALLDATRAEEAEKRKREAEEAARKKRITELEQLLAAEKAALRGKRAAAATVARGDTTGPSAKQVRAWAAENGVDCPATGRVPARVVDAYLAATEAGAA